MTQKYCAYRNSAGTGPTTWCENPSTAHQTWCCKYGYQPVKKDYRRSWSNYKSACGQYSMCWMTEVVQPKSGYLFDTGITGASWTQDPCSTNDECLEKVKEAMEEAMTEAKNK